MHDDTLNNDEVRAAVARRIEAQMIRARRKSGLSAEELANIMGVTRQTVHRREHSAPPSLVDMVLFMLATTEPTGLASGGRRGLIGFTRRQVNRLVDRLFTQEPQP